MSNTPSQPSEVELREKLAAIEHERWSDWQRWVHSRLKPNPLPGFPYLLDIAYFDHWEGQIATPYADLSEAEKQSDREQVDRYWPLIQEYIAAHDRRLKEDLLNRLENLRRTKPEADVMDAKQVVREYYREGIE